MNFKYALIEYARRYDDVEVGENGKVANMHVRAAVFDCVCKLMFNIFFELVILHF